MVLEARRCSRWNVESSSGRYVPSPRLLPLAQECISTDLYNQGVQRNTIDGFLVALASRSPVIQVASSLDYRREQRGLVLDPKDDMEAGDYGEVEAWHRWGTASKGWFVKGEEAEFEDAVRRLVGTEPGTPKTLRVYGRNLVVPWTLGGVARFTYSDLCENALGPADYITLGSAFVGPPCPSIELSLIFIYSTPSSSPTSPSFSSTPRTRLVDLLPSSIPFVRADPILARPLTLY